MGMLEAESPVALGRALLRGRGVMPAPDACPLNTLMTGLAHSVHLCRYPAPCHRFVAHLQAVPLGAPGVMVTPTTVPAAETTSAGGRRLQQVRNSSLSLPSLWTHALPPTLRSHVLQAIAAKPAPTAVAVVDGTAAEPLLFAAASAICKRAPPLPSYAGLCTCLRAGTPPVSMNSPPS